MQSPTGEERCGILLAACSGSELFGAVLGGLVRPERADIARYLGRCAAGAGGGSIHSDQELHALLHDLSLPATLSPAAAQSSVLSTLYDQLDALAASDKSLSAEELARAMRDASQRLRAKFMMDAASLCVFGDPSTL
jgi:hypothetical protein